MSTGVPSPRTPKSLEWWDRPTNGNDESRAGHAWHPDVGDHEVDPLFGDAKNFQRLHAIASFKDLHAGTLEDSFHVRANSGVIIDNEDQMLVQRCCTASIISASSETLATGSLDKAKNKRFSLHDSKGLSGNSHRVKAFPGWALSERSAELFPPAAGGSSAAAGGNARAVCREVFPRQVHRIRAVASTDA